MQDLIERREKLNAFKESIIAWVLQMVSGFDSNVTQAVKVLTKDIFSGNLYSLAVSISNIIKPVALTIITICFLIEFIKITIKMDVLKWEYLLKVFFKLVFAKVAIDISFKLLSAIYATAAEWIAATGVTGGTLGATVSVALRNCLKDASWYQALALVCTMGIAFLGIWISGMIVVVIAYARMIELIVYLSASPIPCAFLPVEESRIPKKFFLSFASICLQGLFIIISIKLYQVICSDTLIAAISNTSNLSDIAFNMLMGSLILVMSVIKSGQWAKNILDAV